MAAVCPAGHASDEPDYCSVCGARVGGAAVPFVPLGTRIAGSKASCPACGEPREDPDARYCEVCRHDFVENRPGPPPVVSSPNPSSRARCAWELVIGVDPALDTDPDPAHPCPRDRPPLVRAVDKPDLLVGRHDETRAIHPEIALFDPGASRRHARFVIEPDGGVALQDLASTNGTQVDGKAVPPGTRRRLREGDSVTLGRWTRITLRGRR